MSRSKSDLNNELVAAYEQAASIYAQKYPSDPQPFLTSTHRTAAEQDALYAIGRTVKGKIVTNAKAGQSPHNKYPSAAFDIAFIGMNKKLDCNKKYFKQFADIIKEINDMVACGIDWKFVDPPHFELKNWKTL